MVTTHGQQVNSIGESDETGRSIQRGSTRRRRAEHRPYRVERLEDRGVIQGSPPHISYEAAGERVVKHSRVHPFNHVGRDAVEE